jgi:transposase
MHILAGLVELACWVDTHKDTPTAAVVQAVSGGVITQATMPATRPATSSCYKWPTDTTAAGGGRSRAPVVMAPASLACCTPPAEQVLELDRPKRAARRHGASLTRWMPSGRPTRPWPAPSPRRAAIGRRCRCG